jgi:hypothetical protein
VWVEAEDHGVSVTIYSKQKTKWWQSNRWKIMWTLLTRGYVERESNIIMSEQQTLNYANVLQSAVNDVKEFNKQRKK